MGKIKFHWNKDTVVLMAKKQWGKTTTIKELINGVPKDKIIILDSNREYKNFPNRWVPKEYTPEELDKFIRYCRQFKNRLLIIEDIDLFFTSANPTKEFKNFSINGSHQDLGLITTLKRPLGNPRLLMTESVHLFIGNFNLKNERTYIEDFLNSKGKIEKIKRFELWYRNNDTDKEFLYKTKG